MGALIRGMMGYPTMIVHVRLNNAIVLYSNLCRIFVTFNSNLTMVRTYKKKLDEKKGEKKAGV